MVHRRTVLSVLAAALVAAPAFAAQPAGSLADQVREEALGTHARGHLSARVFDLGLDRNHDFALKNVNLDATGEYDVRMHQLFQGVRVFEGEAIVHVTGGQVRDTTDALVRGLSLNTTPSITPEEALAAAHADLAPKGSYVSAPTAELVVAQVASEGFHGRMVTRPALVFFVHTELENGAGETKHMEYFVDAHSGRILESWNALHTAGATGTAATQFSGTVSINTNSLATGFELRDVARGMNFDTRDLNHATTGNGTTYTDADNTWGDGANYNGGTTTSANGQTAAVDAHYGVGKTYDLYKNVLGRNGIDGNGTATYSRVHYSSAYDNAFWSDTCFCMTYGDGSYFKSLESIDVAGHEMTHGVCSRTAKLVYKGESGGLNEANSDIMGAMVEFYAHGGGTGTTVPNWGAGIPNMTVYWTGTTTTTPSTTKTVPAANYLIGEQLATSKYTRPLRFMYKPSLDGASQDAWSTRTKSIDVHYSSGPANHFFFLLAHGSQADAFSDNVASPRANSVGAITGVGNDLATRIWFTALTKYMTSSTTYAGARTATLSACTFLGYPSGSAVYTTVNNAWLACNVK